MPNNVKQVKSRRVYGNPLSRYASEPVVLDHDTLQALGEVIVGCIRAEANRDASMRRMLGDSRVAMTPAHQIAASIKCRIVGVNTLEFYSEHPLIHQFTEGVDPYPMKWLTRSKVKSPVPLKDDKGDVIFRMAPDVMDGDDFWVHPGYVKYHFFERGIRKGRAKAMEMIGAMVAAQLLRTTDLLR